MLQRSHRRRIVLFLVAIVVPSLVLIVLSLRMMSQERELAEKRALDEQHRRMSEIRQELLMHGKNQAKAGQVNGNTDERDQHAGLCRFGAGSCGLCREQSASSALGEESGGGRLSAATG